MEQLGRTGLNITGIVLEADCEIGSGEICDEIGGIRRQDGGYK